MSDSKTLRIIAKTVLVVLFLLGLAIMCIGWIKNHARQAVSKEAVKTVESVIEVAKKTLYTGHIGDGKIFVYPVSRVVKIRTGEEDYAALQDVE